MDKTTQLASDLLERLGGADNIVAVENCMTRMRVTPRDPARIDEAAIKRTPGVLGVVDDETYQIILGPGAVSRVTTAFRELLAAGGGDGARGSTAGRSESGSGSVGEAGGATSRTASDAEALAARGAEIKAAQKKRNDTPLKNLIRKIANIFVPLIPALIGAGLVAAVRGLLANWVTVGTAPAWVVAVVPALTVIGSAFFAYLAIFAGINAAKEFGGTPALGGAVAAIIVFPGVAAITYTVPVFGEITLTPGQGGVIGAIFAAILCARIERALRGRIPDAIDILVTPTIALLVSGLATIFVFMFVAGEIAGAIGTGAVWLLQHSGLLAGFVLGGLFLPLVMLGLHQALIPIHATLIEQLGFTPLLTILAMAGAGQVGAAIAIYLKLKRNRSLRDTIKGALPVGVLGVGEPLIYAVSLPLGRPFITACFGGAVGGAVAGAFNQFVAPFGATAIGPSG
ncbi:PTS transporter subunit EIIC, partial [Miniimonas arenae]|uniref:PTS transporter subunit EIIC n=1 Tax=Miniimonas arenae TaxID=676201 RepID=UPI0028B02C55